MRSGCSRHGSMRVRVGVALFFLISGFVIPFSLERSTRTGFLLARCLRIYPTFWLGLTIQWLVIGANAHYWQRPIVFAWPVFVRNALLINTWFDGVSVDFVSWTLNVEIKFYILMALIRTQVLAARVLPLILVAVLAVAITLMVGNRLPSQLIQEAMFITYMLVGTLFHYHHRRVVGTPLIVAGCAILLAAGGLCWAFGPDSAEWPRKPANYAYAVVLFGFAYSLRSRFRPLPLLDGLAAISYPLYLVHSLLGFTVMTFLIVAWGVKYAVAAAVGFLASVLVAWLLHVSVERATMALGRRVMLATKSSVPSMRSWFFRKLY